MQAIGWMAFVTQSSYIRNLGLTENARARRTDVAGAEN